jgi:signal peptidase I
MKKIKKLLSALNPKRLNQKWIKNVAWLALIGGFFIYLNIAQAFIAVASNSMEPAICKGDLIFVGSVKTEDIKQDDVIVFNVPRIYQEKYGYPSTICHRVVRILYNGDRLTFRTKGDATSEDPFMTLPADIIGVEKMTLPKMGYLVMFAQSNQGKIFLVGLIILLLTYTNSAWLAEKGRRIRNALAGISNAEFKQSQENLESKINSTSELVTNSLNNFSSAMSEYAEHIASHTSAIKSLADAAKHMESILSRQDLALTGRSSRPADSLPFPVEVTPELKAAVKQYLLEYNHMHSLESVEVTPELRAAVWNFVKEYARRPATQKVIIKVVPAPGQPSATPVPPEEQPSADVEVPTKAA